MKLGVPKDGIEAFFALASRLRDAADKCAPETTSYVQNVPDKCDRIVWRGKYYHLPLAAAPGGKDG